MNMASSRVDISKMFSTHRFVPGKKTILCVVYFPIGVLLTILRVFLGLHIFVVSCILPKTLLVRRVLLRLMFVLLGVVISCEGAKEKNKSANVIVANHVSVLDHVTFDFILPSLTPCVWNLSSFLRWAMGYSDFAAHEGREALILRTKEHCNKSSLPLLTFPEGAMTNGRVGLLKFRYYNTEYMQHRERKKSQFTKACTWSFSIEPTVQPVLITVSRPIIPVNIETIEGTLVTDLLWFLFVPFSIIRFRFLPSQKKEEGESEEDFAKRIQELMAKELRIEATPYTNADKSEYVKRQLHRPPQIQVPTETPPSRSVPPTPPPSPTTPIDGAINNRLLDIEKMVHQVQEVLPHIAEQLIRKDLKRTSCIDATITNILEARVETTDSDSPSSPGPSSSSSTAHTPTELAGATADQPALAPTSIKFCSPTFGKSSSVRQTSYQERKAALLETARRHYMEKHGMI